MMTEYPLEHYFALPYAILIVPPDADAGEDGWFAQIPDLPGCMTYGDSRDEVLEMIEEAKQLWIEGTLEHGGSIPAPVTRSIKVFGVERANQDEPVPAK